MSIVSSDNFLMYLILGSFGITLLLLPIKDILSFGDFTITDISLSIGLGSLVSLLLENTKVISKENVVVSLVVCTLFSLVVSVVIRVFIIRYLKTTGESSITNSEQDLILSVGTVLTTIPKGSKGTIKINNGLVIQLLAQISENTSTKDLEAIEKGSKVVIVSITQGIADVIPYKK